MKKCLLIFFFSVLIIACDEGDVPPSTSDVVVPDPEPTNGRVPCQNGMAGDYPCNGYDLMSHVRLSDLIGSEGNDCWGWTDPLTSKEYALMCTNTGTSFVDITDAENPVVLGNLRTHTTISGWRDVKTYGNYAFIVSEADGHGMQVFDLTRLRNISPADAPAVLSSDAVYNGFGNAHNIVINEANAYAYAVGTDTFSGGAHIVDISDPLNPAQAGGYASGGYSHDAQVVTYSGPDPDYQGSEIYIGSNENEVVIVDVSDKFSPVQISTINYSNVAYTHQGWFDDDMRFFFLGDEVDETGVGFNTRTIVLDLADLDNPSVRMTYSGPTRAIDHNGYVKGDEFFLSNYTAGLRVIDISSVTPASMNEIGYFDTYPSNDATSFNGAWSVYPFFPSGNIIVSDINSGLFVVRKSQ